MRRPKKNRRRPRPGWLFLAALCFSVSLHAQESQPSSPESSSSLDFANGLYARKMYGPAIGEYEKFIQANPASPEVASARFRAADSYYFTQNYKSAVFYFEAFLRDHPRDKRVPAARFRVGTAKFHLGDWKGAARVFSKLFGGTDDPNIRAGCLFYLGRTIEAKGPAGKALRSATGASADLRFYERLVERYPQSEYAAYAALALGDRRARDAQWKEALRAYAVAADKQDPLELVREAQFKSAEIHLAQKNHADARRFYEKVFAGPLPAEAPPSVTERLLAIRERALLGLFYCDYAAGDLDAAWKHKEENGKLISQSAIEPQVRYLLAVLLEDAKRTEEALREIDGLLAAPPADPELEEKALFKKTQLLAALTRREESLELFDKILGRGSAAAARARFEKAQALESLGKNQEAQRAYEETIQKFPDSDLARRAFYPLALLLLKNGEPTKARELFGAYLKKYPSDGSAPGVLLEMVQIDLDSKNFERASKTVGDFFRAYPESALSDVAAYKQSVALAGLGRSKEAGAGFAKTASQYPASSLRADALYGAALSFDNAGLPGKAAPFYEKILAFHPDHSSAKEALRRLGYLYLEMEDFEKAARHLEEVVLKRPDIPMTREAALWLVRYLVTQRRFEPAQTVLQALPGRFVNEKLDHEVHFFWGESRLGLGDYAKAVEHYSKALEYGPDGEYASHAHLGLGMAQGALNDYEASSTHLKEALRFERDLAVSVRARFEIANLELRSKDLESAARAFMLVAILYDDPKYSALSLYKAGQCFAKLGKTGEAEKAFRELQSRYPRSEWAKKTRRVEAQGVG